jgi:hypothetical protein
VAAWLAAMYSMNTQWLRLDTAFIAVASQARASLARAISAAALAASVTGSLLAPMTTVWPPAASCLMVFASLMRPASGLLPAPSASRSLWVVTNAAIALQAYWRQEQPHKTS